MERHFLIVAADGTVRETLATDLRKKGFTVTLAASGAEAQRVVRSVDVKSVLIESHLPDMPARDLSQRLKDLRPECGVVVLTSFGVVRNTPEMLQFGRNDFLLNTRELFELMQANDAAGNQGFWPWEERGVPSLTKVVDVLVGLLEIEYELFSSSSHLAMRLARATAEEMGADDELVHEVVLGTLLRDVGRAALEPAEQAGEPVASQTAEHVLASERLFEHIDFPWKIIQIIRHHHESYNGSGAPDGLRGREIPMGARIVAVVDDYIAMTCGKGRQSMGPEEALQELVRRAGHHFDPEVVEAFHRVMDARMTHRLPKQRSVVLIVEPEKQFRRLLKMGLTNEGLKVKEATGCETALEQLLKNPPSLALIDVDTDTAAAFQLLHEMQQDEQLSRLPVIFLSQRSDRSIKLRALRQGVDDYLCKNDDIEELVARIQNTLTREALRAEGEVRRIRRGITGSLQNLSLSEIIQTLTIGMKTACVSLTASQGSGKLWFENGTGRHAETGDNKGEKAFFEMVRWSQGEFVIEHGVRTTHATLTQDTMFLLMEGLRLLDEESSAAS